MEPSRDAAGALNPGVRKSEAWAWAMFDFANSGYTTVVITAIYNAYFVSVIAGNAHWGSLAWTAALSVSYALVMVTAPGLGAWADAHGAKKTLLIVTTLGCVLATIALGLAGPELLWLALLLIVIGNYFYATGENLIAAFLPELARGTGMGRLSGWGWGLGYFGGMLTLGACLAYVAYAQEAGGAARDYVPVTLWITAGLFLAAALPTFIGLRERALPGDTRASGLGDAYRGLWRALARMRQYRDLGRFLLCIVSYQAGVQAVITLAAVYAQQAMGFDTRQTITLILVVNVAAAAGALAFGHVQDRIGHRRAIALTLLGWLLTIILAWAATEAGRFWLAALLAGSCLGASQSAGRALVGYLSPPAHRAEFFGLWGMAVKLSSILGPLTYGLAVWLTRGDHRLAMLTLAPYFLLGLVLLMRVDVVRGRRLIAAAPAR